MKKIYLSLVLSAIIFFSASLSIYAHSTKIRAFSNTSLTSSTDSLNNKPVVLNIYPNPVKSIATISFDGTVDKIIIMNIVGKEVKTITPEPGKNEIKANLTDLQPGVYFIAAYNKGAKLITKRFMKEY